MGQRTKNTENIIAVIGETSGHLSQSALIYDIIGDKDGPPPQINLKEEKKNGLFVTDLIKTKLVQAVHDVSHGGIIVTLAEMCMASNIGAKIKVSGSNSDKIKYLFAEDQARYLIEISQKNLEIIKKIANSKNIKIVQDAMFGSTNEVMGTSYRSRIDDTKYQFAGKTGTAQVKRISKREEG